ncbi:MAG: hypothetical protein WAP52_02700 [Candidatus Sungiibacteriota bacterium]
MKKYITVIMSCAAMTAPLVASAAFHEIFQQKTDTRTKAVEMRDQRGEMKAKAVQIKDDAKGEMKEKTAAMRKEMQEKRDTLREEMKKKREDFQVKAAERREALKKKIGEERAGRIEKFFAEMTEKFESAIDRLEKVADRLDDRLNAFTAPAADMAILQDKLTAAHAKITEANAALLDAKIKYADAVKDADLKAAFRKVHDIVQSTAAKVKEAHRALVEVTAAIKGVAEKAAPSTPTNATPSQ